MIELIGTKTILPVEKKGARNSRKSSHTETDRESWCTWAGGRQFDVRDAEEVGGEGMMRIWGVENGKKQAEDESWCTETPIKNDSHWKRRQHTEKKRSDYVARWERQKEWLGFRYAWRMNNVREIELDDKEHKEGCGRQKKRDGKSKERNLQRKQAAVENGWWIDHIHNINHRRKKQHFWNRCPWRKIMYKPSTHKHHHPNQPCCSPRPYYKHGHSFYLGMVQKMCCRPGNFHKYLWVWVGLLTLKRMTLVILIVDTSVELHGELGQ